MAIFSYTARDLSGKIVKAEIIAQDKNSARVLLKQQGYFVTSLKEISRSSGETATDKAIKRERKIFPFLQRVKLDELVIFSRQFATLVRAGLTLTNVLSTLRDQTSNPFFREVIESVITDVEKGETLSDSFAKHPKVFSNLFVSLVRAGEAGGTLDAVLEEIADYYDKEQDLMQKIRSAIAYPIIVCVIATGVVSFLIMVVVPVFEQVYRQMGISLPIPTQMLISISKVAKKYWYVFLFGIVGSLVFYRRFKETKTGKPIVDNVKLRLPIFGNLNLKTSLSRFSRTFGLLVRAGVPIIKCFEIVGGLSLNYYVAKAILPIIDGIKEGESITDMLKLQKIFPPLLVQMSAIGESTGKIEDMFLETARFYDREIDHIVKRLTTIIEPALTIVLGVIVGFIAVALYFPMFDLVRGIR